MGSGTAGLIFAVIAGLSMIYFVPSLLKRNHSEEKNEGLEINERFAESMKIIRRGIDPSKIRPVALDDNPDIEVSTPLTRRAAMNDIRIAHRTATSRRIFGTLFLLAAIIVLFVTSLFWDSLPLWSALIPAAVMVPWLGLCRFNSRTLTRALDEQVRQIREGWTEDTMVFEAKDLGFPVEAERGAHEISIEITGPVADMAQNLWDSIPITPSTYVSRPSAYRTVRTIDLSAPRPAGRVIPPTAERGDDVKAKTQEQDYPQQQANAG